MREVRPATATAPRHSLVEKVVSSVVVSKSIVRGMEGPGTTRKGREYLCNEDSVAEEEFMESWGNSH